MASQAPHDDELGRRILRMCVADRARPSFAAGKYETGSCCFSTDWTGSVLVELAISRVLAAAFKTALALLAVLFGALRNPEANWSAVLLRVVTV